MLYNDAYSQILGSKHPWALGQTCRACWAEIWETIEPMMTSVMASGEATWSDDLLLMLQRFGYPEECYFSFSFSPIRAESGAPGGIFTAVIETTEQVIGERRLRTLRDLAARTVAAKSERDVWQIVASTLAENATDVPFAMLCEIEEGSLVASTSAISGAHSLCAELCQTGSELNQLATHVLKTGAAMEWELPLTEAAGLPRGNWNASPGSVLLLPIASQGQSALGLVLAAVVRPSGLMRVIARFSMDWRGIASNLADVRADETDRKRAEALSKLESTLRLKAEQDRRQLIEMLAQAPAAMGLLSGPEHRWTYVNDLYVRATLRKGPEDFLGKTVVESLPELEGAPFFNQLDHVYKTGQPYKGYEVKARLIRWSGNQLEDAFFDYVYQPIRNAAGEVEGILVHAVDVTDG